MKFMVSKMPAYPLMSQQLFCENHVLGVSLLIEPWIMQELMAMPLLRFPKTTSKAEALRSPPTQWHIQPSDKFLRKCVRILEPNCLRQEAIKYVNQGNYTVLMTFNTGSAPTSSSFFSLLLFPSGLKLVWELLLSRCSLLNVFYSQPPAPGLLINY